VYFVCFVVNPSPALAFRDSWFTSQ
jgi:hypothetical protein